MIRRKEHIKKLSGWEFQKAISKIPAEHDIILRSISEFGSVDLTFMRYSYIYVLDEDKQKYIDILSRGLEHIKNDDLEALFDMEIE